MRGLWLLLNKGIDLPLSVIERSANTMLHRGQSGFGSYVQFGDYFRIEKKKSVLDFPKSDAQALAVNFMDAVDSLKEFLPITYVGKNCITKTNFCANDVLLCFADGKFIAEDLRDELVFEGFKIKPDIDVAVPGAYIQKGVLEGLTLFDSVIDTITNIPCAVSGFCIRNDEVVAFRGPFGVMGLSFYNSEGIFCLASEPQAFGEFDPFYWQKLMNGDPYGVGFRDLLPGEVIGLKDDKIVNSAIINPESLYWAGGSGVAVKQFSVGSDSLDGLIEQMSWIDDQGLIHDGSSNEFRCIFEDIYKKDPPASNHLVSTIRFRARLGRYLSPLPEGISLDDIVVMPVPDSGRSAASGYSNEYQYKMKEGFIKRVKKRSYLVSDARRSELADDKYAVVPGAFNNGKDGKVVVIIDDSIVRGTTIYRMIIKAFEAGARKVFFKSTAPPLRHFCPFSGGMDKKSDFVAMDRTLDEIYSWVFEQCLIELNDKHEQGIYSDEKFDYMLSKINKEFINIEYNTPESLINCYNSFFVDERQRICTGCINGEFPFVIQ